MLTDATAGSTVRRLGAQILRAQPKWPYLALFFGSYVLAGGLGQGLAIIPGVSITFWPPAGLFAATLIANERRSWPWWITAGCLAELTCNIIWFHNPIPFALVYFAANALEAATAAFLLQRLMPQPFRLETLKQVGGFVLLAVGLAPIVGATIIALTDMLIGRHTFATAWGLVWLGDATGLLVSAPLALVAILAWRDRKATSAQDYIEASILGVVLIACTVFSFTGHLPTIYLVLPPLLWISARFQLRGAAVGLGLVTIMVAAFTATGGGMPAGVPEEVGQRIVTLQTFLGLSAVSALVVAAISAEHSRSHRELEMANQELELRVAERTARIARHEQQLSVILDTLPIGVALIDPEGKPTIANAVFTDYVPSSVIPSRQGAPQSVWKGEHADGSPIELNDYPAARALRGERVWPGQEFLFLGREGEPVWTRIAALPIRNDQGDIVGATSVISDIDREKRGLDALRASEERLRLTQRAAKLGTWEVDFSTGNVFWSERARALIDVPPDAPASLKLFYERVHPDDRERVKGEIDQASRPGSNGRCAYQYRIILPDGSLRWLEDEGRVEVGPNHQPVRAHGVVRDVTERKQAEERQQLLMQEVNHRTKNLLSIVQAVARRTASSSSDEFLQKFQERLQAMAASQDLLVKGGWKGVALAQLIRSQLALFEDLIDDRITISGPDITVTAAAAQTLGMAFHELATNAGKYGALSSEDGKVAISWELYDGDAGDVRFRMTWQERGGPNVVKPNRRGFGSTVVDEIVKLELDAVVELSFPQSGVVWRLDAEASRVTGTAARRKAIPSLQTRQSAKSGRVLLVEDDALLAIELADALTRAGFEVVGPAQTVEVALKLLASCPCDAAVIDINLGAETSEPVALQLAQRGTPFVTVSGYTPDQQAAVFRQGSFFSKPVHLEQMLAELRQLVTD